MDQISESQKQSLDRFLADNPELQELTDKLSTFNVFRVLQIERAEIRHSNVLAWLLNPEEAHGLGDIVLKRVLSNILLYSEKNIAGISAAKVELMDFIDIEILREWRNIDLLIVDRNNKLVILIENKIYSGETPGQLVRYQKAVDEEFHSFTLIPIFLTLTGEESTDDEITNYISYSYIQLISVLENVLNQRQSQLSEQVATFIKHYLEVLRRLTMQEDSLIDLCKTIYRRHKEAIDMIVEYGTVGAGQQATDDNLKEGEYDILYSRPKSVWFLPKSWIEIIPENGTAWKHLVRPVSACCWIEFYSNKAHLHFELSAMDPPELRIICLEKLKDVGFPVKPGAFEAHRKYSRFYGRSQKISDMTNYEEVYKVVNKLLKRAEPEFLKAGTVLGDVFKNAKEP